MSNLLVTAVPPDKNETDRNKSPLAKEGHSFATTTSAVVIQEQEPQTNTDIDKKASARETGGKNNSV